MILTTGHLEFKLAKKYTVPSHQQVTFFKGKLASFSSHTSFSSISSRDNLQSFFKENNANFAKNLFCEDFFKNAANIQKTSWDSTFDVLNVLFNEIFNGNWLATYSYGLIALSSLFSPLSFIFGIY